MGARISYLTDDQKAAIYEAALEIMATVGQRVHHPEALELLRAAGAEVVEPDLVKVPRELVDRARRTAPPVIEVYGRDGAHAMSLGRYNTYFGNGSAVTSVYDLETGEHRPTVLADGEMAARLCDALPHVDFVMAYAHPGEGDPHRRTAGELPRDGDEHDQAAGRRGGERRRPHGDGRHRRGAARRTPRSSPPSRTSSCIGEPTSALRHPVEAVDKLILCADRGIPCDLLHLPARRRHRSHHRRRSRRPRRGRVAAGPRHPPAAQAGGALRLRHRPGGARHGHDRSPRTTRRSTSWGTCAPSSSRAGSTCPTGATPAPRTPRRSTPRRAWRRAKLTFLSLAIGSNLNHDIGYLDYGMTGSLELIVIVDEFLAHEPQALRRRRGDAGDAGGRRRPRRRPRRRLPRPPPHRQERAQGAVAADDHQPSGPRALAGGGRARPEGESPPQGPPAARGAQPAPLPAELAARIDELVDGFTPEG